MAENDVRIDGYANALFEVARVEGSLSEVEDELFRFARTLEGSDELRATLTDEAIPASRRIGVVEEGALADLLLVDRDPLADIDLVADPANFVVIMKDGKIEKNTLGR